VHRNKIETERLCFFDLLKENNVLLGEIKMVNRVLAVEHNALVRHYEKVQRFIDIEKERIFNELRERAVSNEDNTMAIDLM